MLIIFSGLPGVGKSTVARALALELGAVWLRIDSIEHAIADLAEDVADAGYRAAYAVAGDNLRLGLSVVADSVNPIDLSREAWRAVARDAGAAHQDVEVICSDPAEHRRRVETRPADIPGHSYPTWREVMERDYRDWEGERVTIDTALHDSPASVALILRALGGTATLPKVARRTGEGGPARRDSARPGPRRRSRPPG